MKTNLEDRSHVPVRCVIVQIQDKQLIDKNLGFKQEVCTIVIILSHPCTKVFKHALGDD